MAAVPQGRRRVHVVDGARTPFLKAKTGQGPFTGSDLAVSAGRALLLRQPFAPDAFDEVILGAALPSADEANIARVVSLRLGCGNGVPAWTVMRNCASGLQALDSAAVNIMAGRADLVLARRRPVGTGAWPVHARLGNALLALRLRRAAGVALHDLGPMRAARRTALRGLNLRDRRFGYPLEMVLRAAERGWRITEVDADYGPRIHGGRSKVTGTVRGTARAIRDMSRVLAS